MSEVKRLGFNPSGFSDQKISWISVGFCGLFFGFTKPQSAKPQSFCGCLRFVFGLLRNVADVCGFVYGILRNFAESLNPNRLNPNRLTAEDGSALSHSICISVGLS